MPKEHHGCKKLKVQMHFVGIWIPISNDLWMLPKDLSWFGML